MNTHVSASACYLAGDQSSAEAALQAVPAAMRRRLSSFAKLVLSAVFDVISQQPSAAGIPVILASRHGDLKRTIELLLDLVADEPLSPTQFCLSVNNAVLGQLSMITNNQQAMTTVGAGANTFGSAWLEGYLQLAAAPQVLIVYADEPLPEPYIRQCNSPDVGIAFAALLTRENSPTSKLVAFSRQPNTDSDNHDDVVATIVSLHKSLQAGSGKVMMSNLDQQWCWHVVA